jgi:RNA polymerase sigma factor (sigma-70 family)
MPKPKTQHLKKQQPRAEIVSDAVAERRFASRKEDTQLIRDALKGNQKSYKRLMNKYHDQIAHVIYRITHNREQIEDLTQEVFIKAFASLKSFDFKFAFSTWLYKIATNSSIDYLRKKKLATFSIDKPIAMEESDATFELPDSRYEPDKHIIQKQRAAILQEAIEQLPEKYKRVILMRHSEERDYSEIAKMLKLPIGTVKAHIFRARELLNKYLRDKISHY